MDGAAAAADTEGLYGGRHGETHCGYGHTHKSVEQTFRRQEPYFGREAESCQLNCTIQIKQNRHEILGKNGENEIIKMVDKTEK